MMCVYDVMCRLENLERFCYIVTRAPFMCYHKTILLFSFILYSRMYTTLYGVICGHCQVSTQIKLSALETFSSVV